MTIYTCWWVAKAAAEAGGWKDRIRTESRSISAPDPYSQTWWHSDSNQQTAVNARVTHFGTRKAAIERAGTNTSLGAASRELYEIQLDHSWKQFGLIYLENLVDGPPVTRHFAKLFLDSGDDFAMYQNPKEDPGSFSILVRRDVLGDLSEPDNAYVRGIETI